MRTAAEKIMGLMEPDEQVPDYELRRSMLKWCDYERTDWICEYLVHIGWLMRQHYYTSKKRRIHYYYRDRFPKRLKAGDPDRVELPVGWLRA